MELIAKRKLHDTDKQFIDEIKKDMFIQAIHHIWLNYPELIDEYWIKHRFNITKNFDEIKLSITIFKKEG